MASLWFTWTFDARTAGMGFLQKDRQKDNTNSILSTPLATSGGKDSGPRPTTADPVITTTDPVTTRSDLMTARTDPVSATAGPVTANTDPVMATTDPRTDPAAREDSVTAKGDPKTARGEAVPARTDKAQPVTASDVLMMTARADVSKTSAQRTVTSDEVMSEAVTFLGLLRHNEDQLVERMKQLMKRDRRLVQLLFSVLVEEWTPLHACTLRGARKLVKLALKCGVPPDLEMGAPEGLPGHCSPLHLAAYRGDVSFVQLLVQGGALVSKKDSTHRTPLFYAASNNNTLAARKLIKYGADLDDLTPEQRLFYKEDIERRPASLLCIPVQSSSGNR